MADCLCCCVAFGHMCPAYAFFVCYRSVTDMSQDSRIDFKINYAVKLDFLRKVQDLGYVSASECLRDMVEIVAYNGERTPKEKVLTHHLARIQNIMTAEQAEKVWNDFCRFMEEYRYAIFTTRLTEEEFFDAVEVFNTEGKFMMQFVHMHGYSLMPSEIRDLIHHYYHDAEALQLRRKLITDVVRAHAAEASWDTIASPAEKDKIAKTTTL